MRVLLHDVEVDEPTLDRLEAMDCPSGEGVRRAVALYDALENPDEVLRDVGELGGGADE